MEQLALALARSTAEQRQAVEAEAPVVCVLAGAGSGKTRVVTLRTAHRVATGTAPAAHTLVCTFTRAAAAELRHRLATLGTPVAAPLTAGAPPGDGVRIGTIHQLALSLVTRHAADSRHRPPVLVADRAAVVAAAAGEVGADPALLDAEISWAKARRYGPDAYEALADPAARLPGASRGPLAAGYRAYQAGLARRRALDLDDLLVVATSLLEDDPGFAGAVRWRYRHVAVDEYQDVNPAQAALIDAVRDPAGDLTVVGDPNQAIYGWNGADPSIFERVADPAHGALVVRLDVNHRSTPEVVGAASAALGPDLRGTPASARPAGEPVTVRAFDDGWEEAEHVATMVAGWAESGRSWRDLAVLARTNDLLGPVAGAFRRAGIPFSRGRDGSDTATLTTFHGAKGLEWGAVAVIGIEDGLVPLARGGQVADRREERRLLYVALSRATDVLHCSWAARRSISGGHPTPRRPSPWLAPVAARSGPPAKVTGRRSALDRIAGLRDALGGTARIEGS